MMAVQPDTDLRLRRNCRNPKGHPKIKFESVTNARRSMRSLRRQGARGLNVYRCPQCAFFHVGHRA